MLGLGPAFVLKITLQNAGNQALTHSKMMFTFDPALYVMGHIPTSKQCFTLAPLLPVSMPYCMCLVDCSVLCVEPYWMSESCQGVKHVVEAQVQNIDPQGKSGQILILLNQANTTRFDLSSLFTTSVIYLCRYYSATPLLSASVKMPVSELAT